MVTLLLLLTLQTSPQEPYIQLLDKKQCSVSVELQCEAALNEYKKCYKKTKEINVEHFCKLFQQLVEKAIAKNQTEVTLPRVIGLNFEDIIDTKYDEFMEKLAQNTAQMELTQLQKRHHNCQDILCFADDPLKEVKDLPESVNLIEQKMVTQPKDQGECNAGWVFTSISALENALLRDGSRNKIRKSFWAKQAKSPQSLDLSEQFFMSNTRGYNSYCDTGDFSTALNYMQKIKETIESEANYPYDPEHYEARFHKLLNLKIKIDKKQRYRPFRVAHTKMKTWQKTPIIKLYYDPYEPMDESGIRKIKSYLARGIQVAVTMFVDENGPMVTAQGKEVLQQKCTRYQKNHQVSIIGYDKMNMTTGNQTEEIDVWIVKNSWGTSWGDNGLFYVPIGRNDFCMEQYALAILPKYYDVTSLKSTNMDDKGIINENAESQEENDVNKFGWYLVLAAIVVLNIMSIGICIIAGYKRRKNVIRRMHEQEALIS